MITDTTASGATDSSAADSVSKTLSMMREKLDAIVPDAELQLKAEIVYEINRLKEERGAIILGHNYMEPALFHTVPDLVGDSLGLARAAAETDRLIPAPITKTSSGFSTSLAFIC